MSEHKAIQIEAVDANLEREALIRPFGFKGGYMSEIWQAVARMDSADHSGVGLDTQGVLWSDAAVFAGHSEAAGNALMFAMTEHALQLVKGESFSHPIDLLEKVLPETYEYGKKITNNPDLRLTFALNSLVAFDNAVWLLYARENGITSFDDLVPDPYKPALSCRQEKLASIPLMAYAIPIDEIVQSVEDGYFFLKVTIGADPDKDGDREKMLHWDMQRIEAIHKAIGAVRIPHTKDGKIPCYFDANGRYDSKDRLARLLDHARKIGAFDQIAIVEEPFPEEFTQDVSDLGVRIAADESAHSDSHAAERIQMGYGAIALKPIAKTLSMTLKVAKVAHEANVPCFCADLTVTPMLVEWNKNVAARLAPLPGMTLGVLETNGHQNYKRWEEMMSWHPYASARWARTEKGLFHLDDEFYRVSGGIFETIEHYQELVSH